MNNKKIVSAIKYSSYGLFLILLYVLQTTPSFLKLWGLKPFLIIPAVICIAMYEGEFVGGLYGAFGGMLCDLASYTVFGFYSILLLIACVTAGLLVLYYMKNTRLNSVLICGGTLLALAVLEYFFYYAMWGHAGRLEILLGHFLPRALYSLLFVPLFYWLFGWASRFFEEKIKS